MSATPTCRIDLEPLGRRVECAPTSTLLQAIQPAGIALTAVCGGQGICGRCTVHVLSGNVSPPTPVEQARLAPAELVRGVRLACQTIIQSDARIYIPAESLTTTQRLQLESASVAIPLEPAVTAHTVRLDPPALTDVRADATRLADALDVGQDASLAYDPLLLRQLSDNLRAWGWQTRVVLRGREVIAVRPVGSPLLGLAVDIGTTKLAAYLLDLETGQMLGATGAMNPQIAYGEDVMARIAASGQWKVEGERDRLQQVVVDAINEMATELCAQVGAEVGDIADAVAVGNTAMHHLFAGLPVGQLGVAPYVPAVADPLDLKAREVGLFFAPGAYVHLLPNIAGFVGADHVAMLLASGLGDFHQDAPKDNLGANSVTLGLDIGTNTEICLRAGNRLWACSAASGPAFEGAHIEGGMRAAPGAIEHVVIAGDRVYIETVDNAPPLGLCGSGIVDLIAWLRRAGILDARGAFRPHPRVRGDRFIVVAGEREIALGRADIAKIQLAQAAIRAGMRILLRQAGLTEVDVQEVIIAGAFGTYLDVESAIEIGLLLPLPRHCFRQIGNAAGAGARMALLSVHERARAARIAHQVEYVELTAAADFRREFARALRPRPI